MERKSYVYKITCLVTGEYYFGSSFRAKSDRYWGGGKRIRERIAQYGKENFVKEILEEFDDRVEAHKKENQYIEQFRNDDKCLNQMLNRHFGSFSDDTRAKIGASNLGEKNPMYREEVRAKISAALRGEKHHNFGKHRTEDVKAKISAALRGEKHHNFGKHLSEETRSKLSAAHRGKTLSEGHKAEISASLKGLMSGDKNPMYSKHHTEEAKAKIGAAKLGKHWRKNPVTGKREYYD